ncbi:hypothetical protein ACFT7S_32080 [Streptomyces sp. NPDC057136]|uniref:hypothetical protein n=1 Tax=Streptomyces sp. NPDC057136 TaxID=3346029 RepID=UPI00362B4C35
MGQHQMALLVGVQPVPEQAGRWGVAVVGGPLGEVVDEDHVLLACDIGQGLGVVGASRAAGPCAGVDGLGVCSRGMA